MYDHVCLSHGWLLTTFQSAQILPFQAHDHTDTYTYIFCDREIVHKGVDMVNQNFLLFHPLFHLFLFRIIKLRLAVKGNMIHIITRNYLHSVQEEMILTTMPFVYYYFGCPEFSCTFGHLLCTTVPTQVRDIVKSKNPTSI